MKKIMFNDKYGLTKAVLEGRKTQTRRVINLTETDKEYLDTAFDWDLRESVIVERYAKYKVGEEVAIAQKYSELEYGVDWVRCSINKEHAGWNNKMFVSAEEMPHRIKITNIRIEHLQDISDADCFAEGAQEALKHLPNSEPNDLVRDIFSILIDNVSGKGTWQSNPYVFVYDFELIR